MRIQSISDLEYEKYNRLADCQEKNEELAKLSQELQVSFNSLRALYIFNP